MKILTRFSRNILYLICFVIVLHFPIYTPAQNLKKPLLMAHYMPWFQTKEQSGYWGWHWTMNHYDPGKFDSSGKREIASHYYPLTGPYDSQDSHVLEYQVLLMKLSGIDGVLVDWYGDEDYNDYGVINKSTGALFSWIKKANLKFAIVYEDQTIQNMINGGRITSSSAISYGSRAVDYLSSTWFNTDAYLKIESRPVLLVFGPQYFKKSSDWETIFGSINPKPLFFTEDNYLSPVGAGAYPWPPMWKTNSSGVLTQASLNDYLTQFYQRASSWNYKIGSAFPAFHDIYKEAGVSSGYGFLDSQNGATFSSTLEMAVNQNCDVIQLVTWNDYGEGTIIEPTVEFGYRYLEKILEVKKLFIDQSFSFTKSDLELPLRIFKLRKAFPTSSSINLSLDRAFNFLISRETQKAKGIIDSLTLSTKIKEENVPDGFRLFQNYPNPFNPETTISYKLQVASNVSLKVFDLLGREVETLVNEFQQPGNYSTLFTLRSSFVSGVYFYRLSSKGYTQTKSMFLIK